MTPRSRLRTAARWTGRLAAGAVALLLLAATTIYGVSARDLSAHYEVPAHPLVVPTDPVSVVRGERLAKIKGCVDCHGAALAGNVMLDDPAVGRISAPNLTVGGRGADLTDADWERAVRHGVRRDGSPLFIMPANEFATMSDEDVSLIVAYARSLPATTKTVPAWRAGPVLRALHVAGQLDMRPAASIEHGASHRTSIVAEATPAYGKYLAAGCTGCHGQGFSGGKIPGAPPDFKPAANLTPSGIGHYTEADFVRVLRTGMRPSGVPVDSSMPWKLTREMTDTEISAIYQYLRTVPARAYGTR